MSGKGMGKGDSALRRRIYGEYAKAAVCISLGEEMQPEAKRYSKAALELSMQLGFPTEEDLLLRTELEEYIK